MRFNIKADLRAYTDELASSLGMPVDIQVTGRKSFDGIETAFYVLTVLASGVGGGLLSSIGEDLWKGLKSLIRRITSKGDERIIKTVVIHCKWPNGEIRYSCQIDQESDLDRFSLAFIKAMQTQQLTWFDSLVAQEPELIEFALQSTGEWKKISGPASQGQR